MKRKTAVVIVLLLASLFCLSGYAGGYQRYVIYYSDSSFSTPVGKKFVPSSEGCDPPYDALHQTGTVTVYVYNQARDICGTVGSWVTCTDNGTAVTCPSGIDWVEDWNSLGDEW